MITVSDGLFVLNTLHTTYSFHILPTGHPEHLYYGARIELTDAGYTPGEPGTTSAKDGSAPGQQRDRAAESRRAMTQKAAMLGGNGISFDAEHPLIGLEDLCLEMSALGHGDIRTPLIDITWHDGAGTTCFLYDRYEITARKSAPETLPASCDAENEPAEELHVYFREPYYDAELEMIWSVFPDSDVIARRQVLRNISPNAFLLHQLMSLQLDLDDSEYVFHTFTGHWAREMNRQDIPLCQGRFLSESRCGISSSMNNPFMMLSRPHTTETAGECMAFNLIYSGNHMECAEVNAYGKTRILTGIHPEGFTWEVNPGESFESPEALMVWTDDGFDGISQCMHPFVREHIVRGEWQHKERPVLLNSWEAMYFDFNEEKLLDMAVKARDAGIELFVMDDGWFGRRNDSRTSLGDWQVNTDKLPGGLSGLARKIRDLGMGFGIWVEPEMISVKSRLYEEHPDWSVDIPGLPHSEGRSQRILDLTRTEVQDWLIDTMSEVFGSDGVTYVKWDNNRIFTDIFSRCLTRQSEFLHRYYIGYYRVMGELVRRFPHILFEGCASGGNRFDLGVLCYMPQIWASDDTDPICRTWIQSGLSYGYPASVVSAHVSASPNHQTSRQTSWETRFGVAAFGVLGYELNLALLTPEELENVKEQIHFYKKYRRTLQFGSYHRLVTRRYNDFEKGIWQWMAVSPDRREAVGFFLQEQTVPNQSFGKFVTRGLDPGMRYHFTDWQPGKIAGAGNGAASGDGTGAEEDYIVSGSLLNHAGIRLMQACSTPGHRAGTRFFTDGSSRVYCIKAVDE